MKVTFRDKHWELPGRITARDLLKKLDMRADTVLVVCNGRLVTEDTLLNDEDTIRLVSVISGG